MKPARFGYHRAGSLTGAVESLAELGDDAKVIAGGQSLIAMMNFRLARPTHLVDIGGIQGLDVIDTEDDGLRIGALATHHQVETAAPALRARGFGVIADAMSYIGHLPIRTRGTVGGSLAHADATAEWCLLAILLDAEITVASIRGERTVAAGEFFFGFYSTALDGDEVITDIRFPRAAPNSGISEYARRHGDFAIVAAAADVEQDDRGSIVAGRVVVAGIEPVPRLLTGVSEVLHNAGTLDEELMAACTAAAVNELDLSEQPNPEYLAGVIRNQVDSALTAATATEVRT